MIVSDWYAYSLMCIAKAMWKDRGITNFKKIINSIPSSSQESKILQEVKFHIIILILDTIIFKCIHKPLLGSLIEIMIKIITILPFLVLMYGSSNLFFNGNYW